MEIQYSDICAYVGKLYLENQHTHFLFNRKINEYDKDLLVKSNYIDELEKRIKELMQNGNGS